MSDGVSGAGESVCLWKRISEGVRGPRGDAGRDSLIGELISVFAIGGIGKCVGGAGKEESEAIDLTEASATIFGGGSEDTLSTGSSRAGAWYRGGRGEGLRFGVTGCEDAPPSCSEGWREEYSGAGFSSMGVPGA